jgi:hypothetical protein
VSTTGARIRSPRKHGDQMVIPRSHTGGIRLGAKPVSRCRDAGEELLLNDRTATEARARSPFQRRFSLTG